MIFDTTRYDMAKIEKIMNYIDDAVEKGYMELDDLVPFLSEIYPTWGKAAATKKGYIEQRNSRIESLGNIIELSRELHEV